MKHFIKITAFIIFALCLNSCVLLQPKAGVNITTVNANITTGATLPNENDNQAIVKTIVTANSKSVNGEPIKSSDTKTGFYIGVALSDVSLTEKLKFQPEANLIIVKDFNQIHTPLLLKYNFSEKFSVYTGPNMRFLLDSPQGYNNFSFAIDAGLSYHITEKLIAEARYDFGLGNLLDNVDSDNYIRMNNIQLGLAYKFDF